MTDGQTSKLSELEAKENKDAEEVKHFEALVAFRDAEANLKAVEAATPTAPAPVVPAVPAINPDGIPVVPAA